MDESESAEIIELHAIVRGMVQGVGFRATTQGHARAFNLRGKVRNCEDGSVELIAQGTADQLESFLSMLRKDSGHGSIEHIEAIYGKPSHHFDGFQIVSW